MFFRYEQQKKIKLKQIDIITTVSRMHVDFFTIGLINYSYVTFDSSSSGVACTQFFWFCKSNRIFNCEFTIIINE